MKISRRLLLAGAGAAASAAAVPVAALPAAPAVATDLLALAMQPIQPLPDLPWSWWTSDPFDGDTYQNEADTREEALENLALEGGHIIEARQQWFDLSVSGDDLYEAMMGHNDDAIGEGDFIEATDEQLKELADAVNLVIAAWADKHKLNDVAWRFAETRNREKIR